MQPFRGVLMLVAAGIAFYRGWEMRHSVHAWIAFGLGVVALGLAIWHMTLAARHEKLPNTGGSRDGKI